MAMTFVLDEPIFPYELVVCVGSIGSVMIMGPQEDYIEMVLTCKGDYYDPNFHVHLKDFSKRLENLIVTDKRELVLKKVEPWNSVRVTFNIPKEAAVRLKHLAEQGNQALRELGVLAVQIEGDRHISLTIAGKDNETTQIVFRTSDQAADGVPVDMSQYFKQQNMATNVFNNVFAAPAFQPPVVESARSAADVSQPVSAGPVALLRVPTRPVGPIQPGAISPKYPTPPPSLSNSPGVRTNLPFPHPSSVVNMAMGCGVAVPGTHQQQQQHQQHQQQRMLMANKGITSSSPLLVNLLQTDASAAGHFNSLQLQQLQQLQQQAQLQQQQVQLQQQQQHQQQQQLKLHAPKPVESGGTPAKRKRRSKKCKESAAAAKPAEVMDEDIANQLSSIFSAMQQRIPAAAAAAASRKVTNGPQCTSEAATTSNPAISNTMPSAAAAVASSTVSSPAIISATPTHPKDLSGVDATQQMVNPYTGQLEQVESESMDDGTGNAAAFGHLHLQPNPLVALHSRLIVGAPRLPVNSCPQASMSAAADETLATKLPPSHVWPNLATGAEAQPVVAAVGPLAQTTSTSIRQSPLAGTAASMAHLNAGIVPSIQPIITNDSSSTPPAYADAGLKPSSSIPGHGRLVQPVSQSVQLVNTDVSPSLQPILAGITHSTQSMLLAGAVHSVQPGTSSAGQLVQPLTSGVPSVPPMTAGMRLSLQSLMSSTITHPVMPGDGLSSRPPSAGISPRKPSQSIGPGQLPLSGGIMPSVQPMRLNPSMQALPFGGTRQAMPGRMVNRHGPEMLQPYHRMVTPSGFPPRFAERPDAVRPHSNMNTPLDHFAWTYMQEQMMAANSAAATRMSNATTGATRAALGLWHVRHPTQPTWMMAPGSRPSTPAASMPISSVTPVPSAHLPPACSESSLAATMCSTDNVHSNAIVQNTLHAELAAASGSIPNDARTISGVPMLHSGNANMMHPCLAQALSNACAPFGVSVSGEQVSSQLTPTVIMSTATTMSTIADQSKLACTNISGSPLIDKHCVVSQDSGISIMEGEEVNSATSHVRDTSQSQSHHLAAANTVISEICTANGPYTNHTGGSSDSYDGHVVLPNRSGVVASTSTDVRRNVAASNVVTVGFSLSKPHSSPILSDKCTSELHSLPFSTEKLLSKHVGTGIYDNGLDEHHMAELNGRQYGEKNCTVTESGGLHAITANYVEHTALDLIDRLHTKKRGIHMVSNPPVAISQPCGRVAEHACENGLSPAHVQDSSRVTWVVGGARTPYAHSHLGSAHPDISSFCSSSLPEQTSSVACTTVGCDATKQWSNAATVISTTGVCVTTVCSATVQSSMAESHTTTISVSTSAQSPCRQTSPPVTCSSVMCPKTSSTSQTVASSLDASAISMHASVTTTTTSSRHHCVTSADKASSEWSRQVTHENRNCPVDVSSAVTDKPLSNHLSMSSAEQTTKAAAAPLQNCLEHCRVMDVGSLSSFPLNSTHYTSAFAHKSLTTPTHAIAGAGSGHPITAPCFPLNLTESVQKLVKPLPCTYTPVTRQHTAPPPPTRHQHHRPVPLHVTRTTVTQPLAAETLGEIKSVVVDSMSPVKTRGLSTASSDRLINCSRPASLSVTRRKDSDLDNRAIRFSADFAAAIPGRTGHTASVHIESTAAHLKAASNGVKMSASVSSESYLRDNMNAAVFVNDGVKPAILRDDTPVSNALSATMLQVIPPDTKPAARSQPEPAPSLPVHPVHMDATNVLSQTAPSSSETSLSMEPLVSSGEHEALPAMDERHYESDAVDVKPVVSESTDDTPSVINTTPTSLEATLEDLETKPVDSLLLTRVSTRSSTRRRPADTNEVVTNCHPAAVKPMTKTVRCVKRKLDVMESAEKRKKYGDEDSLTDETASLHSELCDNDVDDELADVAKKCKSKKAASAVFAGGQILDSTAVNYEKGHECQKDCLEKVNRLKEVTRTKTELEAAAVDHTAATIDGTAAAMKRATRSNKAKDHCELPANVMKRRRASKEHR